MLKISSAVSIYSLLIFCLCLTLATPGAPRTQDGQSQRPRKVFPKQQDPEDVLRFDTDLVSVDVTAINSQGLPVKNLKQEDFKVFSDGVEQPVSFFQIEKREGEARPLAIVFAIDISADMLDVDNSFDCLYFNNDGGDLGNSCYATVHYILYRSRYPGSVPLTAITN